MRKTLLLALCLAAGCKGGSKPDEPAAAAKPLDAAVKAAQPTSAEAPPTSGTGLPDCDALIAAYEQFAHCAKVPQTSRDAMAEGLETMKDGWGDVVKMGADQKKSTNEACKQGIEGVKTAIAGAGC